MKDDDGDTIRVVLADDQVLFVEMLELMLENGTSDIKVVGTAFTGREAVDAVLRTRPHVALLDVRMPDLDGIEANRLIKAQAPEVGVMMLTTFDDDAYVHDSIEYGAVGYLLKNAHPDELIACIRAVRHGALQISPAIAKHLIRKAVEPRAPENDFQAAMNSLSPRELEVVELMFEAYSNSEISDLLCISEQTVKNHISVVYSKLGVSGRFPLIRLLKDRGFCAREK